MKSPAHQVRQEIARSLCIASQSRAGGESRSPRRRKSARWPAILALTLAAGATLAEDETRLPTANWTAQAPLPPAGPYPIVAGGISRWFPFDAGSGLEQPRLQIDGAAAARAGNVTLNITQPYALQARAGQNLNLYLVTAALGNITQNAAGAVNLNYQAQLLQGGVLVPGMSINPVVAAPGLVDQFRVARALNVAGGNNFAITLNTTLATNTAAGTAGNNNNLDFNSILTPGTPTEQNFGIFSAVVASPRNMPNSRNVIGVNLARIDPRLLVAGGQPATGRGIVLGQIELGRPYDNHVDLPAGVLDLDVTGGAAFFADEHALAAAGIMVSRNADPERQGVAPGARLFSSAFTAYAGTGTQQILNSAAFMVDQAPTARVINCSFGIPDQAFRDADDGDSPTARLYDFLVARRRTIVVNSAGNGGTNGFPLPGQEGFQNGLVLSVGNSISGNNGSYNSISVGALDWDFKSRAYFSSFGPTDHPVGMPRTKPDIMAPGTFALTTVAPDVDGDTMRNDYERVFFGQDDLKRPANRRVAGKEISGTSFAAPHVTGAIGMMLEFADFKDGSNNGDRSDPRIVKAAIMNSADRTIRHRDGAAWTQGVVDVLGVPTAVQPLDNELGAGMLRINQAMLQIEPNEARAADNIPNAAKTTDIVGRPLTWDRQQINRSSVMGSRTVYYGVDRGLVRGQAVRTTVNWYRGMNATDGNLTIEPTDTFNPVAVSNLDLNLWRELPKNDPDRVALGGFEKIRASASLYDNVELIAASVPRSGPYWLQMQNKTDQADEFGIAINIGSNPAASGGLLAVNQRLTPEDGVADTVGDLLAVEQASAVFVKHTFDRSELLTQSDRIFILDDNDGVVYAPGSQYSIYFGPELRDSPGDPNSDTNWFDGPTISLAPLLGTGWRLFSSMAADSEGNLPPTLISDAQFLADLAVSPDLFPEFNFVIDVDNDGTFTREVDGVGWFQVAVPEPGTFPMLIIGGLIGWLRRTRSDSRC